MRISDWSSDVCSSDLVIAEIMVARDIEERHPQAADRAFDMRPFLGKLGRIARIALDQIADIDEEFGLHQVDLGDRALEHAGTREAGAVADEIGSAWCRERVC